MGTDSLKCSVALEGQIVKSEFHLILGGFLKLHPKAFVKLLSV
jgi:hypothetical protein